ncbi:ABC transporter substrate-binding protein [Devosia sp. A449]
MNSVRVGLSAAVFAASLFSMSGHVSIAQELTNVRVALPWFRNGQYAALMAADVNGYFAEEGLKIEPIDGGPGKNPILTVGTGQAEIGISFPSAVVSARVAEQPVDVVAIGAIYQMSPYGWVTLANPGDPDPKPEDMAGKRVGIQSDGEMFIAAVANKYGFDMSSIDLTTVQGGAEPLLTGAVDYASGWVNDIPFQIETETAKPDAADSIKGKTWKAILLAEVGFSNFNNVMIASGDTVRDNPEMIRKFMKALARGLEFMAADTAATAAISVAYPGQIDGIEKLSWSIPISNGLQQSDATREHGYLWMEPEVWEGVMQFYFDNKLLARMVPVEEIMTNEFNPGILSK